MQATARLCTDEVQPTMALLGIDFHIQAQLPGAILLTMHALSHLPLQTLQA